LRRIQGTLGRGATGGFIAAAALAFWFLVIDSIRAAPFDTPMFVARTVAGLDQLTAGPAMLLLYTVLHFGLFMLVGMAVAWVLDRIHMHASLLIGLVLGFLLFDLIFYAGIVFSGTDVVGALGWPEVLIGNLISAIVLTRYLRATEAEDEISLREVLSQHRTIREGLFAGLLGAAAVMLWFFVLDVVQGRVLFTPAALGSALFFGARGLNEVVISATTITGYTGVHLFAFLLVGLGASAAVEGARRQPSIILGIVLFFVTLEVLFIGLMAIAAAWLLDAISWWTIVVGNLVAAGVMGGYLLFEHPELRENLSHDLEEELVSEGD
jgi:hypothetical protein